MASTMRWQVVAAGQRLGAGDVEPQDDERGDGGAQGERRRPAGPSGTTSSASSRPGTGVGAPSSMRTSAASSASTSPRPGQERQLEAVDRRAGGRDRGRRADGVAAVVGGGGAAACALRHRVRPADGSARYRDECRGTDGAEHERLGLLDRALALGAVGGDAASGQARVDQRHRDVEVLLGERAGLDARGEDAAQDLLDHHRRARGRAAGCRARGPTAAPARGPGGRRSSARPAGGRTSGAARSGPRCRRARAAAWPRTARSRA